MKNELERVLVVQSEGELARYTCSLLDEIGFRHVVLATDHSQLEKLWKKASDNQRPYQLVVCDDEQNGSALKIHQLVSPVPMLIFSTPNNPHNLRLAAKIGLHGLVFRPYGRDQIQSAMKYLMNS